MGGGNSKAAVAPTGPTREAKRVTAAAEHVKPIRAQFESLAEQIQGNILIVPASDEFALGGDESSDAYHTQRERSFYFNGCNYPSVIVLPETHEDVAAAVKLIHGLDRETYKMSIACGCHSTMAMVDNAICLDLCHIKDVSVDLDSATKTMSCGGGCKIVDVHNVLGEKAPGYGFVTGTNTDTGVSGLTLSGGAGYLGWQAGWACDTVTQIKVVLATGEIVTATDDNEHKDLLRAVRGGGGNFGVVVEWTFKLYDVSNAYGGLVVHMAPTLARSKIVMTNYMNSLQSVDTPDSGFSMLVLPAGAPVMIDVLTVIGDDAKDAKTYTDIPFLAKQSKLGAWFRPQITLGRKDYIKEIAPQLEPFQQPGYGQSIAALIYTIDEAMVDALIHITSVDIPKCKNVKPTLLFMKLGGEQSRSDGSKTGMRHGKAKGWAIFDAAWEPHANPEEIKEVVDWATRSKTKLIEIGGEDGPHNFADTDGRRIAFYSAEQRTFLEGTKAKYDPTNLFSLNKNVAISHTE